MRTLNIVLDPTTDLIIIKDPTGKKIAEISIKRSSHKTSNTIEFIGRGTLRQTYDPTTQTYFNDVSGFAAGMHEIIEETALETLERINIGNT